MVCLECRDKPLPHELCRGNTWCDCQHRENAQYVSKPKKENKND